MSAPSSRQRLTLATTLLLLTPPLLWAGNAVVGRMMQGVVPPITLNFLRWLIALVLLLPLAGWVLRPGARGLWPHWRRFALLGLLGVGCYNSLQYLALKTSTPINVTLVAASMPVWMLLVGRLLYGEPVSRRAALGAALSIAGVLVVLSRGEPAQLRALQFVPGDAWMLLATLLWSWYSWLLARPKPGEEPSHIKADWAAFLLAQVVMGVAWSGLFSAGEWLSLPPLPEGASHIQWGWPLLAALAYVAIGPSLLAYRCWGAGVTRMGPAMASFFSNLTPLFAALLSALLLGEPPRLYHAVGFVLIVGGILVSSRR
ncbi:DMT family transporter [Hydrogenophaga sp.]|uniref:DMT family transporter n=1 Tax=Hydrogenophaga sp. TaxID=1904254 RepID=UPI002631B359|nr:DMT family transporter [Hydrogenophaga sp.]MCW5653812.1 DMT family transporter [Hydrogenophaga sp.]